MSIEEVSSSQAPKTTRSRNRKLREVIIDAFAQRAKGPRHDRDIQWPSAPPCTAALVPNTASKAVGDMASQWHDLICFGCVTLTLDCWKWFFLHRKNLQKTFKAAQVYRWGLQAEADSSSAHRHQIWRKRAPINKTIALPWNSWRKLEHETSPWWNENTHFQINVFALRFFCLRGFSHCWTTLVGWLPIITSEWLVVALHWNICSAFKLKFSFALIFIWQRFWPTVGQ